MKFKGNKNNLPKQKKIDEIRVLLIVSLATKENNKKSVRHVFQSEQHVSNHVCTSQSLSESPKRKIIMRVNEEEKKIDACC